MHIWTPKIYESWSFCVFFSIFSFSQFWVVLRCSHSAFRLRGLISCSGLVSNRPDMKYQAYSNFRVHMVFMCRPIPVPNYLKYSSIWHETKTIRHEIIFCMPKKSPEIKRMFKLYALFIFAPKFYNLSFFWKFKTSSPPTPYYPSSLYILGIYALRVTLFSPWGRAFKWFAASAERQCILNIEKSSFPAVLGCFFSIFSFSQFCMILSWSDSQNQPRSLISCPGLLLNRSGL